MEDKQINAFTLAEVLITLGIIGVVASVTLPSIIQHHRKQVVETRLKHFYSTINQAIALAEVEQGEKVNWQWETVDEFWDKYLKNYIKYIKAEKNGRTAIVFWLPNGSIVRTSVSELMFYPDEKSYRKENAILGRDRFRFEFRPYMPETSAYNQNKAVEPYLANWHGNLDDLTSNSVYGCNATSSGIAIGSWCTAVIQRNGWKIPKNYPFKF